MIFVFISIKFTSAKKFTFPLPPNRYFEKSCAIEEVAVRPNMMADLPILHFRNPCHNSFLEKYRLHGFTAFCACSSSISLDMCIK